MIKNVITVRCDTADKPSSTDGKVSQLPKAFVLNSLNSELSEKELLKRIEHNPTVQLCTRLATCRVNRDGTVYDPKKFGILGKHRLYLMIGTRLKRATYNRMCLLSNRQWKTIEESWTAIMHSVLLHSEFNPILIDRELRIAICKFKIWFLEQSLRGHVTCELGKKPRVILSMWDKVLKGLKTIAGWFQFYALDDRINNIRPPSLPWFYGWKGYFPTFPWFAGHLKHFKVLETRELTDLDIRSLCQIRTFGRALPTPSKNACIEDLHKQIEVLTTPNPVSPLVLQRVSEVSALLAEKLKIGDIPMQSHISVSTSGCFEVSQKDGGLAAYIRGWVKELDQPISSVKIRHDGELYDFIDHRLINISEVYRDCYGNRMFPGLWASDDADVQEIWKKNPKIRMKARIRARVTEGKISLLDKLYRQFGHFRKAKATRELLAKDLYPSEVCPAILAVASSEAILQGRYLDTSGNEVKPNLYLVLSSGREIPIFSEGRPLRYESLDYPKVQMQCLAEPGAKTRSLGKNQAWFVIVTKIMRFMIEPILARDGRARIGLVSTNKMWSFLKFLQKKSATGQWLQSTDYSAATDYISLDMLSAMWTPFFSRIRTGHPFLIYKDLVFCRRSLHFDGIFKICDNNRNHECGSFMGEPMSFMSLTLINLIVEELSACWKNEISCFVTPVQKLESYDPVAICGDDVASVRRSLTRIKVFKHIVKCVGMKLSWKDGISRRLLIFCEEHIIAQNKEFIYIDVIKSRLLTTMARQHSDNRSAILGKGRMLGTQLAYFDNRNLRIFVMKIYDQVFDRCHKYQMVNMQMPYFLPPSCGGLGYPIPDTQLPGWSYMFIGYIFKILEEPNILIRYYSLYQLSRLTKRNKHGLDNSSAALAAFAAMAKTEEIQFSNEPITKFESRTIYPDARVRDVLTQNGIEIPSDPYTGGPDRDHLRNEAQRFGIIRLDDLFEQIERTLNFDVFFRTEVVREQRTFTKWVKQSGVFWKKALFGLSFSEKQKLSDYGREKFKNLNDLDNQVLRSFSGYVFPLNWGTLDSAGPSLRMDFRVYRAKYGKYPFIDRKPVSIEELFNLMPYRHDGPETTLGACLPVQVCG
nr:MAG: RNA-dependent RNA polymerase [Streptophyte associated narna-like virus 18]